MNQVARNPLHPLPAGHNTAERVPQVRQAVTALEQEITALENALGALVERLEPICMPTEPSGANVKPDTPVLAPVAFEIETQRCRLASLVNFVAEARRRLEI